MSVDICPGANVQRGEESGPALKRALGELKLFGTFFERWAHHEII